MISFPIRARLVWASYLLLATVFALFGFVGIWTDIGQQASENELNKHYLQDSYVTTGRIIGVGERLRKSRAAYAIVEVKRNNETDLHKFESRDLAIGDQWTFPDEVKDWFGKSKEVECLRLQLHCRLKLKNREVNDDPITFMSAIGAIFAIFGSWAVIRCFTRRRSITDQLVYRMRRKSLENFKP